jgi:hypothetical protein
MPKRIRFWIGLAAVLFFLPGCGGSASQALTGTGNSSDQGTGANSRPIDVSDLQNDLHTIAKNDTPSEDGAMSRRPTNRPSPISYKRTLPSIPATPAGRS